MLHVKSIKPGNVTDEKIIQMEFFLNTRVLTLRPEKRWENACDCTVFAPKIRLMVAYICNLLILLR